MLDKVVGARDEVKNADGVVVVPAKAGRMFRFDTFPVEEGFDLLGACLKHMGAPLIGAVMGGLVPGSLDAAFLSQFDVPAVKGIVKKLLSVVSCLDPSNVDSKGLPTGFVSFDGTFKGRYLELFEVAVESFKYNFADFLAEIQVRNTLKKMGLSSPKPA